MNTNRYKYVEHQTIPSELVGIEHQINSLNRWDKGRVDSCGIYLKSKLSKGGFRHHFHYDIKMGIKTVVEVRPNPKWSDLPSKYFILRKFKSSDENCLTEISELYYCRDCEVYCWSNNRIVMDDSLFNHFSIIKNP